MDFVAEISTKLYLLCSFLSGISFTLIIATLIGALKDEQAKHRHQDITIILWSTVLLFICFVAFWLLPTIE